MQDIKFNEDTSVVDLVERGAAVFEREAARRRDNAAQLLDDACEEESSAIAADWRARHFREQAKILRALEERGNV